MELMYPITIAISLAISLSVLFINIGKNKKYESGKRVANTKFIKETKYYKQKVARYRRLSNLIKITYILCILAVGILIARPIKYQTNNDDKYNRDILLSIDLSASEDKVNYELVRKFRSIIPYLSGDRIGIIIFNTAPVVFCPLTDDYEYIDQCLDKIEKNVKIMIDNNGRFPKNDREQFNSTVTLFSGGVIANYEVRGSSLVGDGLARNSIFFS